MSEFWLGVGALALLQITGAAIYAWACPLDARDVWRALAAVTGWPILAPIGIGHSIRWHWQHRHLRTPKRGEGIAALIVRLILRLRKSR